MRSAPWARSRPAGATRAWRSGGAGASDRSLRPVARHPVGLAAQRPALQAQQLEMRERLGRRGHHLEAAVGADGERLQRHLVRGTRPLADDLQHGELAHAVEVDELARAPTVVLEDAAVRGADEAGLDTRDLVLRGEEVSERVWRAAR